MAQGNPMPGEKYLHFKNRMYQVIAVAYHSETMEPYVVYQALYGDFKTYIRPYDMFVSEVDHEKYPDVKQKYRFQYMPETGWGNSSGRGVSGAGAGSAEINGKERSDPDEPVKADVESQPAAEPQVNVNAEKRFDTGIQVENAEEEQRPQRVLKVLRAGEKRKASPDVPVSAAEEPEEKMNPWLEKFLDAKGFEEKYRIVCDMQRDITDRLIDDIAVVMDLAIPEGDLIDRYGQLKYCMRTRQKYEMGRLR
ncbi:MAG: DUF1653 domain-containing protein [Clostridiales bacterium]|nr:DUF1653 domain-containing protein [Clostridiales bacterium]